MEHRVIAVGSRPICIWDLELEEWNRHFLRSFAPNWFLDQARVLVPADVEEAKVPVQAALGVRLLYHHALETLFAFVFAGYQAPAALPAWLSLYRNYELRELTRAVSAPSPIFNAWGDPEPQWRGIAEFYHGGRGDAAGRDPDVVKAVSDAWSRLAYELRDPSFINEYNAIKHGLRAIAGPMKLEVGDPQEADGRTLVGESPHGTFVAVPIAIPEGERLTNAHHIRFSRGSLPWTVRSTIQKLDLITRSLSNVHATLKAHSHSEDKVTVHFYDEPEMYGMAWADLDPLRKFSLNLGGPTDDVVDVVPKKDVMAVLRRMSGLPE